MHLALAAIDTWDAGVRHWGEQFNWPAEYILRLLLASVAGGLVGLERELRGRQAGFLGAGTILKHGASVRGLTTAAAMWCVAAIGMAAGFGMYTLAVVTTGIV